MIGAFFNHPVAAAFVVAGVAITVGVLALEWESIVARLAR